MARQSLGWSIASAAWYVALATGLLLLSEGSRFRGLGLRGFAFRVFRVKGSRALGFRDSGLGVRVLGSGFWVSGTVSQRGLIILFRRLCLIKDVPAGVCTHLRKGFSWVS